MPRGGSKPGERRGGRKPGTPNKPKGERAVIALEQAEAEVRVLILAGDKITILGKDRLAELDVWSYAMAQKYAPKEDERGNLYWDCDGDELRFMRFLNFCGKCALGRAQFESPKYAAIAVASQGKKTPEIYKRDPAKVMDDIVARWIRAEEQARAEKGLPPPTPLENQQARLDQLEAENAELRGLLPAPDPTAALPAPERPIDVPTSAVTPPGERSDLPQAARYVSGQDNPKARQTVVIDGVAVEVPEGAQVINGRINGGPPRSRSDAENKANMYRVNNDGALARGMTRPSSIAGEPQPSTGPRIVSGSGELFPRSW